LIAYSLLFLNAAKMVAQTIYFTSQQPVLLHKPNICLQQLSLAVP
jgi:hypothetical protein